LRLKKNNPQIAQITQKGKSKKQRAKSKEHVVFTSERFFLRNLRNLWIVPIANE
jgi:hypothetical protein